MLRFDAYVIRHFQFLVIGTIAILATSCASEEKLQSVTGEVTVAGKPANGALLMFHADPPPSDPKTSFPATAKSGPDGKFSLDTGSKTGVRPGKYIVTITWPDPNKKLSDAQKMMGANPEDAPDLLGGRYATREKSSVKVDIQPGIAVLPKIELK